MGAVADECIRVEACGGTPSGVSGTAEAVDVGAVLAAAVVAAAGAVGHETDDELRGDEPIDTGGEGTGIAVEVRAAAGLVVLAIVGSGTPDVAAFAIAGGGLAGGDDAFGILAGGSGGGAGLAGATDGSEVFLSEAMEAVVAIHHGRGESHGISWIKGGEGVLHGGEVRVVERGDEVLEQRVVSSDEAVDHGGEGGLVFSKARQTGEVVIHGNFQVAAILHAGGRRGEGGDDLRSDHCGIGDVGGGEILGEDRIQVVRAALVGDKFPGVWRVVTELHAERS